MKRKIVQYALLTVGLVILVGLGLGMEYDSPVDDSAKSRSAFAGDCMAGGIEYRGQYSRDDLKKVFGGPDSIETRLVPVELLGRTVRLHPKVAVCAAAVERERKARGIEYPIDSDDPLGGIGGYRASDSQLGESSYHRYGAAVDLNPSQNPHCRRNGAVDPAGKCDQAKPYTVPDELVAVFKRHGFAWGGNWWRDKDYMHFEWHGEQP